MKTTLKTICKALPICLLLVLSACSAANRVSSINNTFLEDVDTSKRLKNLPYNHSWAWVKVNEKRPFKAVYFKPVLVEKLPTDHWERSASALITSKEDYVDYATEIAKFFHEQLIAEGKLAFKKSQGKKRHFQIVDQPGPRVLVIEIALTELEFSHPVARTATLIAPVPGTAELFSTISDPHMAFAMRITSGKKQKLLATVADRKYPPTRLVDFNKLTVTSSAREISQLWAKEITQSIAKGHLAKTESLGSFSLLPW